VLAAGLVLGCKDNPGFAISPDGPAPDTTTSVAESGTTIPPDVSTSSGDVTSTFEPTTSTTEAPPLTTTTTGEPPPSCTDGILDDGEECDDGNQLPHDDCNNHCRVTFDPIVVRDDPEAGCTALLAAPLDPGDDLIDLLLIRGKSTPDLQVLENDGDGGFVDNGHIFNTVVSTDVVLARTIDGDDELDIIAMPGNISLCLNNGDELCGEGKEIGIPEPQLGTFMYVPGLLAVDEMVVGDPNKPGLDAVVIVKQINTQKNVLGIMPGDGKGMFGLIMPSLFYEDIALGQDLALAVGEVIPPADSPDVIVAYTFEGNYYVSLFYNFAGDAENPTGPFKFNGPVTSLAIADLGVGDELGDIIVAIPEIKEIRFIGDANTDGFGIQPDVLTIGSNETKVVAAPLRGDGTRDIVTFEEGGTAVRVAAVLGGKLPDKSYPHETTIAGLTDFVVADFDGDGDGDIAVVNSECSVRVLVNQSIVEKP